MEKAVFFDRDGTVNIRIAGDYIKRKEEFKFIPDFIPFFKFIKEKGFLAVLVTNQQGIGKGKMTIQELNEVHEFMQNEMIKACGFCFDDIDFCQDLASTNSFRRKPNPGMILEAEEKWNIDPKLSWMIGDKPQDVIAGKRAGTKTLLLGFYNKSKVPEADYIKFNLNDFDKTLI
jgi:D-glycero-D-manno-heptose 1,7-bisphosphate phosphatase